MLAAPLRHRLMDAFLARLARHPEAEGFVLRGGARIRRLAPGADRPALDLDLVCRLPYEPPALRTRLVEILAIPLIDGVRFDPDRLTLDPIWRPIQQGVGVGLAGEVGGARGTVAVDVLFGLPLWPPPEPVDGVWSARPEAIVARKVRVIARLGRSGWRPKDLADLAVLLASVPVDRTALGEALDEVFGGSTAEAREVFGHPAWWSGRFAAERWDRFRRDRAGSARIGVHGPPNGGPPLDPSPDSGERSAVLLCAPPLPGTSRTAGPPVKGATRLPDSSLDLDATVASVRSALRPILGQTPRPFGRTP